MYTVEATAERNKIDDEEGTVTLIAAAAVELFVVPRVKCVKWCVCTEFLCFVLH